MVYDLAIIGGGPAGMIAAGHAAELGASVILLEKNQNLGVKLLITGKERCNFTNYNLDVRSMLMQFGLKGKFLFSALNKFGVTDIMDFMHNYGVEAIIESDNRVFPSSNSSRDVLNALLRFVERNQVTIKINSTVKNLEMKNDKQIEKLILSNGDKIWAKMFLICSGGKSYPATGSSGEVYDYLSRIGHTVIKPKPALTPLICKEKYIKNFQGVSLKNVKIDLFKNDKLMYSDIGDAIFTDKGMSGPLILNISRHVEIAKNNNYKVVLDLLPNLKNEDLDKEIINEFNSQGNKKIKNVMKKYLSPKMISNFLQILSINPEKKVNEISSDERKKIGYLLKSFVFYISDLAGFDVAMITSGGVDLKEIDPKTLKSKLIDNLFFAGEIIDLDGPTGGYNLQMCWSTGFAASEGVLAQLNNK